MALIKCPECGNECNDTDNFCPNCGYHFSKLKNSIQPVKYETRIYEISVLDEVNYTDEIEEKLKPILKAGWEVVSLAPCDGFVKTIRNRKRTIVWKTFIVALRRSIK